MNCTVHVRDDGCEVWVGTQVLARAQAAAAKAAGLPLEKVLVHNHLIGGGFGRRLEIDGVARAVEIAKHVDGPVKVVWTREVMGAGAGCGFAGELECDMELDSATRGSADPAFWRTFCSRGVSTMFSSFSAWETRQRRLPKRPQAGCENVMSVFRMDPASSRTLKQDAVHRNRIPPQGVRRQLG